MTVMLITDTACGENSPGVIIRRMNLENDGNESIIACAADIMNHIKKIVVFSKSRQSLSLIFLTLMFDV